MVQHVKRLNRLSLRLIDAEREGIANGRRARR
jgi:hypothetical protein